MQAQEIAESVLVSAAEGAADVASPRTRKSVVHFTSVHPPFDFRVFHKECKTIARAGYDVTLIAPSDKAVSIEGVRISPVAKQDRRTARVILTASAVLAKCLRMKADLYQFHDPELIPVALLLTMLGRKVIYDIHEDVPRNFASKPYLFPWVGRAIGFCAGGLEHLASRMLAAYVLATPSIAERFPHARRSTVLCNYPSLAEFPDPRTIPWDTRSNVVGYVGGIFLNRGAKQMVEALSLLPTHFDVKLKIAGKFFPAHLADELRRAPGAQRLELCGYLERSRMIQFLSDIRVGLVVLHPLPQYKVALPVKMFEYMAAGVPVIASDFPLWRDIVKDAGCGLLVDPLDPSSIAEAIKFLLAHPKEAFEMGIRGREAVERRYNWELEEKKLLTLYAELLEDHLQGPPASLT